MQDTNAIKELESMTTEELFSIVKNFDRIIVESVEAGVETGKSLGVLESYNFLLREGFKDAANALMVLVEEDEENRKKGHNA